MTHFKLEGFSTPITLSISTLKPYLSTLRNDFGFFVEIPHFFISEELDEFDAFVAVVSGTFRVGTGST